MITVADLDAAIAKCQGERNPNANTCIKLAAYYTIKNAMAERPADMSNYSFSPAPVQSMAVNSYIEYDSNSDFGRLINGRDPYSVWAIVDELMDVLLATNPRLYHGVMHKIDALD